MKAVVYLEKGFWWFALYEKGAAQDPQDTNLKTIFYARPSSALPGRWNLVKKELRGMPYYRRRYDTREEAEKCATQALQHELNKRTQALMEPKPHESN